MGGRYDPFIYAWSYLITMRCTLSGVILIGNPREKL